MNKVLERQYTLCEKGNCCFKLRYSIELNEFIDMENCRLCLSSNIRKVEQKKKAKREDKKTRLSHVCSRINESNLWCFIRRYRQLIIFNYNLSGSALHIIN